VLLRVTHDVASWKWRSAASHCLIGRTAGVAASGMAGVA
jgi:hypothetical protein